jgi:hypothetical protein
MNRFCVLLLCLVSVFLISGQSKEPDWQSPYTPTRLDWLVLQCNVHHPHRYHMVHTSFVASPPNKVEVVVKIDADRKQADAALRKAIGESGNEYVHNMARAMGWNEPLDVHATEVVH